MSRVCERSDVMALALLLVACFLTRIAFATLPCTSDASHYCICDPLESLTEPNPVSRYRGFMNDKCGTTPPTQSCDNVDGTLLTTTLSFRFPDHGGFYQDITVYQQGYPLSTLYPTSSNCYLLGLGYRADAFENYMGQSSLWPTFVCFYPSFINRQYEIEITYAHKGQHWYGEPSSSDGTVGYSCSETGAADDSVNWLLKTAHLTCLWPTTIPSTWPSPGSFRTWDLSLRQTSDPCPSTVRKEYCNNHGDPAITLRSMTPFKHYRNETVGTGVPFFSFRFEWHPTDCTGGGWTGDYQWRCPSDVPGAKNSAEYGKGFWVPKYYEGDDVGSVGINPSVTNPQDPAFCGCTCDHGTAAPPRATTDTDCGVFFAEDHACEDCHCGYNMDCEWNVPSASRTCLCAPGQFAVGDSHCKFKCSAECGTHTTGVCYATGTWPNDQLDHCVCSPSYWFGKRCDMSCYLRCNNHPLESTSCGLNATSDGYSPTVGCYCAIGWRRGAYYTSNPSDPYCTTDPTDAACAVNDPSIGSAPYLCPENYWHIICNQAHTVNGIDYSPTEVFCICDWGWGGPYCNVSCPAGCGSCDFLPGGTICTCNGHGVRNPITKRCTCDEGYAGRNCTSWITTSEACPTDVQPQLALNITGHSDELSTGVLQGGDLLCSKQLAYNRTTGKCTYGPKWDKIMTRVPGEANWHWMRRIYYRLYGAILPKTNATTLAGSFGLPATELTHAKALIACGMRSTTPAICGDIRDPYRLVVANHVFERNFKLNCVANSTTTLDVLACWTACAGDTLCTGVEWNALTSSCKISHATCTLDATSTTHFYACIRPAVYYGQVTTIIPQRFRLERYVQPPPASYRACPGGALLLNTTANKFVCVCQFSLSYDYEAGNCFSRDMLLALSAYDSETVVQYVTRLNVLVLGFEPENYIAATCGEGSACRVWTGVATDLCALWTANGGGSTYCQGGLPRVKNSLFQLSKTFSGASYHDVSEVDPITCVNGALATLQSVSAIELRPASGSLHYTCRVFTSSGSLVAGTNAVWIPSQTSYLNSYADLHL